MVGAWHARLGDVRKTRGCGSWALKGSACRIQGVKGSPAEAVVGFVCGIAEDVLLTHTRDRGRGGAGVQVGPEPVKKFYPESQRCRCRSMQQSFYATQPQATSGHRRPRSGDTLPSRGLRSWPDIARWPRPSQAREDKLRRDGSPVGDPSGMPSAPDACQLAVHKRGLIVAHRRAPRLPIGSRSRPRG